MLIDNGIDAEKIFVCGLPVRKAFRAGADSAGNQQKEILIMGGGLGLIKNIENFLTNFKFHSEIHVTIVTGKNIRIYEQLSRFADDMPNVEICGYIEDIERYYGKADLIVTKPGGITMFEAIYTGTLMLVTSPELIQEKANARFISEKHIGRVVSDEKGAGAAALQMLGDSGGPCEPHKRENGAGRFGSAVYRDGMGSRLQAQGVRWINTENLFQIRCF